MARFVLVHGAFSGAWIWGPLVERLKAAGHSAEAFDLPGLGDDQTPASEVTLDACAARLCEVLAASSEPAVVVGNSMGGISATEAAARCPERVAALVYATAFVPKDGQSLLDLTKLPEGAGDQVQANITIEGEPPVAIMPAAASRHALYGSCAEDVAAWAMPGSARNRSRPSGRRYRFGLELSRASTGISWCARGIGPFRWRCSGGWPPRTRVSTSLSSTRITRRTCR